MELRGTTALVTGAGHRVGRAIAEELGRAFANVAVHFHGAREGAAEACAVIEAAGGKALAIQADLRDATGCARLVAEAEAGLGPVRVLVNSAAAFERARFEDLDDAQWESMLALNLVAPARMVRLVLPAMRAAGGGVVVNILDVAALASWKSYAHYTASKAGLAMLTRTLAAELAPLVRVNGVAPGTVVFPASYGAEERARVERSIPLGRIGDPLDVARAVRFLIESDYVTGVIMPVDGGRLVGGGGLL